ncbi:MAG TPA: tandem-95 repeat protein [Nitrospirae bacterium]|nr:tandem-95 repeat protein [Nitrospirota bacterium]
MYVKLPDPQNGQKVIKSVLRSDGKFINEENSWLSKTRDESDNWVYYINFFDDNTTDSYTVVFEDPSSGPQPPMLQLIPDRSGFESRQISFIVEASDPNGTIPMLSAAPLPAGATFTDQGDTGNGTATGIFDWTPSEGQSGTYEITFTAFDGLYTDTERAVITINSGTDTDGDGMPDDWETNYFGDITRDGTGDYDNDGLSDLDEYLSGTDPANPDTDGDGMPDGWETAHGLNPNFNDAAEDPDNDGYSNLEEYEGGSDPFDPESIPDRVPVANAGPDQNVMTGETVTLDGSGSNDPERAMITFLWAFTDVPAGSLVNNDSLTDAAGAKPEFTPDVDGTYRLNLTVNDGVSDSTQDEVLITASVSNVAPNADAGPDRNALTGSLVNIDGSRSNDPDSGPQALSYQWSFDLLPLSSSLTDSDIIDNTLASAGFTPDLDGTYMLKLTVSDNEFASEDRVEITTTTTGVPPNADAGDDIASTLSLTAVLDGSASNDPDGQPQGLTYGWSFVAIPVGSSITNSDLAGADTASPSFIPDTEGTYVLGLVVSDGQNTDSDNTAVTVTVPVISILPEGLDLGSVSVGSSSAAQTLTIMNSGSADLEIYSINIEGTDASMFNAAAETCLNLTPVIASGENCTISVIFSPSSTGIKSADLSIESGDPYNANVIISLSGTGMNTPPAADAGGPYIGTEGQAISFDGSGSTDLNGDALQYQWDFDNDGTWDSGWSSSPIADYVWNDDWSGTVKLEVSDGEFSDTDTATVTVNNVAPNVEAGPDKNINEGETVDFSGSFTDPGADTHTIVWDFGDGSPQAGTLSETHLYADDGVYTVALTVTDDDGGSETDTLTITVNNVAPMADNKSVTLDEDATIEVVLTASDPGDDELSFIVVDNPANGSLSGFLPNVTYTPNLNFNGTDSFTYKANDGAEDSNIATVTITVNAVNDAPVAADDTAVTDEDNAVTINVTGNDNAGPADEDQILIITTVTQGANGMVINMGDGTVNYVPNQDYNGTDSFSYTISDSEGLTATATVTITVNAINDAPVVLTDTNSQPIQYSDEIALVTITASDIDSSILAVSTSWTKDGGTEQTGLPDGLSLNTENCTGNLEVICSRVLEGKMLAGTGEYNIVIAVDDGAIVSFASTTINVETEDADLEFDEGNPIAVEVPVSGGNSGSFNLIVHVKEMLPDWADRAAYPGDISLAEVSMSLQPAGPGSLVSGVCTVDPVSGSGYEAVKTVTCGFDDMPVSTYTAELTIDGNYYEGYGEDVVVIYDPGLEYVSGGGWFYWPGTENTDNGYPGDRTNFGFTMTYNSDCTNIQGNLLLISHLPDGAIYRVKSNAPYYGLSMGEMDESRWASFSGESTYLEPGWSEPADNYEFTVYMEDRSEHHDAIDRFWIELVDQDGNVINNISMASPASDNTEELQGGNIFVPHHPHCHSEEE